MDWDIWPHASCLNIFIPFSELWHYSSIPGQTRVLQIPPGLQVWKEKQTTDPTQSSGVCLVLSRHPKRRRQNPKAYLSRLDLSSLYSSGLSLSFLCFWSVWDHRSELPASLVESLSMNWEGEQWLSRIPFTKTFFKHAHISLSGSSCVIFNVTRYYNFPKTKRSQTFFIAKRNTTWEIFWSLWTIESLLQIHTFPL